MFIVNKGSLILNLACWGFIMNDWLMNIKYLSESLAITGFFPLNYNYDDLCNIFYHVKSVTPEINPIWALMAPVCWYFIQDSCLWMQELGWSVTFLPTECLCLLSESITNYIHLVIRTKSVLSLFFLFFENICVSLKLSVP